MARKKRNEVTETAPGTFEVKDDTPIPQVDDVVTPEMVIENRKRAAPTTKKTKKSAAERTETLPNLQPTQESVTVPKVKSKFHPTHGVPGDNECMTCGGHGFKHRRLPNNELEETKCEDCNGTGDRPPGQTRPSKPVTVTQTQESEDINMASKKKSSKKSASKKSTKSVTTAAPIGRERKLLLRLSNEEYKALQVKAEKQGTSMANLLRTSAIG